MNTKSDFTNIELIFPPDLFLKGEELYESGGVIDIHKVEKNLYSFIVKEGGKFEVEWQNPLTKSQKASCDCSFFKIGKMCKHTVAALLAFKAIKPEPQKSVEKSDKVVTLNISGILNNLTKDEIKSFVRAYATSDKRFATAFKVHFARKVDLHDNEKKYKSILDTVIRPVTSEKSPFKASDVKSLLNITEEFYNQAGDAIALGQFGEAFLLVKTSIGKLCYTYHHVLFYESELEKAILKGHDLLRTIVIGSEVHDLTSGICQFLMELSQFSYYPFLSVKNNAISLLLECNQIPGDVQNILENQLWRKREQERQRVVILGMMLRVADKTTKNYQLDTKYISLFEKVAEELKSNGYFSETVAFCETYRLKTKDLHLIHIDAVRHIQPSKVIAIAAAYFVENKDLRIVDTIKAMDNPETFAKFRSLVSKSSSKIKSDDQLYAHYLYKSNQEDLLLAFLQDKRDFRLLMQFDEVLFKDFPGQITSLYESMVEDYLNMHVGQHAMVFIDELFAHFNKIKASKITNKLGIMIEMKFPHRSRLGEMIK